MLRRLRIPTIALGLTAAALAAPTTYADPAAHQAGASPGPMRVGPRPTRPASGPPAAGRARCGSRSRAAGSARCSTPTSPRRACAPSSSLVTDGDHADRQSRDMTTVVTRPDERSLRFTQVSTDKRGPLPAHRGGRHRPGPQRGRHPRDRRVPGRRTAHARRPLRARAGQRRRRATGPAAPSGRSRRSTTKARVASTLVSSPSAARTPARARQAQHQREARATISLGFGRTPQSSSRVAKQALAQPWTTTAAAYDAGWHDYLRHAQAGRRPAPRRSSASTSPRRSSWPPARTRRTRARSWPARRCRGSGATRSRTSATRPRSYHEVWSRDLYQIGTALYAMGDVAAAQRAVQWLFRTQQKKDGSFPQNSDVGRQGGVDRDPARPGHPADRARAPGRPDRQADLQGHQEGGRAS